MIIDNKKILKEDNIRLLEEISKGNMEGYFDLTFKKDVINFCKEIVENVEIQPSVEISYDGAIHLEWYRSIRRQLFVLIFGDYIEIHARCDNNRIGKFGNGRWELRFEDRLDELDEDWFDVVKVKVVRDWNEARDIVLGYYEEFWNEGKNEKGESNERERGFWFAPGIYPGICGVCDWAW